MRVTDVALGLYEWARRNGALADSRTVPGERMSLSEVWDGEPADVTRTERGLMRAQISGVIVDDVHGEVTVATKRALGPTQVKSFPDEIAGTPVKYIGHVSIEPNPPAVPHASTLPSKPWHLFKGRIACGTSVTVANIFSAGTLGCLVRHADGTLCGLTNNHVTGDCNHTPEGMHILAPSPCDAEPSGPAPTAIGRHRAFVPLSSGDPQQLGLQEIDAAIFSISHENLVCSMQGSGSFDTPNKIRLPTARTRVKKVGRTSGLTLGTIRGKWATPLGIPYKAQKFNSLVYFNQPYAVAGDKDLPFSRPGDSGSLVVTEDHGSAVGLILGGAGKLSIMMPLKPVLAAFNVTLVSGHGL
jgi:hypothetical protein